MLNVKENPDLCAESGHPAGGSQTSGGNPGSGGGVPISEAPGPIPGGPSGGGGSAGGGLPQGPITFGGGEPSTTYHYTNEPLQNPGGGLKSQSYTTDSPNYFGAEAADGLCIPEPDRVYPITFTPSDQHRLIGPTETPGGRGSGGYPEYYLPDGSPPGSVGPPQKVKGPSDFE